MEISKTVVRRENKKELAKYNIDLNEVFFFCYEHNEHMDPIYRLDEETKITYPDKKKKCPIEYSVKKEEYLEMKKTGILF